MVIPTCTRCGQPEYRQVTEHFRRTHYCVPPNAPSVKAAARKRRQPTRPKEKP